MNLILLLEQYNFFRLEIELVFLLEIQYGRSERSHLLYKHFHAIILPMEPPYP